MDVRVGVATVQGDYDKHIEAFARLGHVCVRVREPQDLESLTHLVLPGGESTTVGLLMQRYGLGEAIRQSNCAVWGTCMGMIMMAKSVEGRQQYTLDLLDIVVRRNAFGAQVHSFEDRVEVKGLDQPVTGVFIRAPIVTEVGPGVEALSEYDGIVVAVRQGRMLGTSFHPELTDDDSLHRYFLGL
jgi:5'-phosphate synthase pdxT subunit